MGQQKQGKCRQCNHKFTFDTGGGYYFDIMHCDRCGKSKSISKEKQSESKNYGKCRCRGSYTKDAPIRCPNCRSDDIEDQGTLIHFD